MVTSVPKSTSSATIDTRIRPIPRPVIKHEVVACPVIARRHVGRKPIVVFSGLHGVISATYSMPPTGRCGVLGGQAVRNRNCMLQQPCGDVDVYIFRLKVPHVNCATARR